MLLRILLVLLAFGAAGAAPDPGWPLRPPVGFQPVPVLPDNPLTPEKIALGERLSSVCRQHRGLC